MGILQYATIAHCAEISFLRKSVVRKMPYRVGKCHYQAISMSVVESVKYGQTVEGLWRIMKHTQNVVFLVHL